VCYSLWYNEPTMLPAGGRERAFKQFKSPVLNVLRRPGSTKDCRANDDDDDDGSRKLPKSFPMRPKDYSLQTDTFICIKT